MSAPVPSLDPSIVFSWQKLMQDCNAVGAGDESFMLLAVPAHKN